ncbi:MAG TPA: hypothetical protein VG125_21910 [Pirellulales bacterium]|jgi:putative transposase|nr:hypothetical protein [Pirellulales bacterium]
MFVREEERERRAFEEIAEYIARNPGRARLVAPGKFRDYRYTGCVVPGYPDLSPWEDGYWERFWRLYQRIRAKGLVPA